MMVEDDATIAGTVVDYLSRRGVEVMWHENAERAAADLETGRYDVGIVDLLLPGEDGLSFIGRLRRTGIHLPILILSVKGSVKDRIRGLNAGGDDYLPKPFCLEELEARIRALHRRKLIFENADRTIELGNLTLYLARRRATVNGRLVDLRPKEYAVLEYLCENSGTVVSKRSIIERVWGYQFDTGTNLIEVVISRLRSKLRSASSDARIRTTYGTGYGVEVLAR